jgi:hypothetical protein
VLLRFARDAANAAAKYPAARNPNMWEGITDSDLLLNSELFDLSIGEGLVRPHRTGQLAIDRLII